MTEPSLSTPIRTRLEAAQAASREIARLTGRQRADALESVAQALEENVDAILAANARDREAGEQNGLSGGLIDRLALTEERISSLAASVRHIAALTDPLGQVIRGSTLENGVKIEQVRVPFGVVGVIYEARPNVTVDIAALALRSGNAVALRGGSAALHSNEELISILRRALERAGVTADAIQTVDDFGRDGAAELMKARGLVDVLIPRGSAALIDRVVSESTVPVIETGAGIVHIYIDSSADAETAVEIIDNAKTQRPSVCNAVETVLVHRDVSPNLVSKIVERLLGHGVDVRADEKIRDFATGASPAAPDEWATEHLELRLGMRVVDSLEEAIEHIRQFSTKHTDAIVTNDMRNAERFLTDVDSAVVMVNASTRFTDGGVFGFGAEVGISTQKLHARGPMGLSELTSSKWVVRGDGQVRA